MLALLVAHFGTERVTDVLAKHLKGFL